MICSCGAPVQRGPAAKYCSAECQRREERRRGQTRRTESGHEAAYRLAKARADGVPERTTSDAARVNRRREKREASLRRVGWTSATYDAALLEQGGKCFLCDWTPKPGQRGLHADHDHVTGKPRHLLCSICNRHVVGKVESCVGYIDRLIVYCAA